VRRDEGDRLSAQFEASRPRLRALTYRMLGSVEEADDAVQETWLRVGRADAGEIEAVIVSFVALA
jgi:DNA-directed RNA polymerase specialized sigma24 family protein